jgi:hypothetical protein
MSMKNNISKLILLALIVLFAIQGFAIVHFGKQKAKFQIIEKKSEILLASLFYNYRYKDSSISQVYFRDLDANRIRAKDIAKMPLKIVFYYPGTICSTCFQQHFEKILEILKAGLHQGTDYCILTRFDNFRTMKLFRKSNGLNCDIFNIEEDNGSLLQFLPDSPILFSIDDAGIANNFFLIGNSSIELVRDYVNFFGDKRSE